MRFGEELKRLWQGGQHGRREGGHSALGTKDDFDTLPRLNIPPQPFPVLTCSSLTFWVVRGVTVECC